MESVKKSLADIEPMGGHPVLDFVNTVHSRFQADITDYLHSYEDVVQWQLAAGLVSKRSADTLLATAGADPAQAARAFKCAIGLRETLYDIFLAIAHNEMPTQEKLDQLNGLLASHSSQQRLQLAEEEVCWECQINTSKCESLIGPIVRAAAELLTSRKLGRIKECPAPDGCGWLFLDTSKNRSRSWCSMKTCGNLAKVRRFRKSHAAD